MGDCGPDTMCIMAGLPRQASSRVFIRTRLADFVNTHRGNRALIWALHSLCELTTHLQGHDLDSAGRDLFSNPSHVRESAVAETSLVVALPESRVYSDAETEAVIWKCRLHRASKHAVLKFMSEVPETTIAKIVKEHEHRDSAVAEIDAPIGRKQVFLLRRDQPLRV